MELLIAAGADVNMRDRDGKSALSVAAETGYTKCVNLLLTAGADVNNVDVKGNSVLHQIADADVNILRNLFLSRVKINVENVKSKNALEHYIWKMKSRVKDENVLLLFAAGETISTCSKVIREYLHRETEGEVHQLLLSEDLDLKHLCRDAIRKHLLAVDPHTHLFGRVHETGTPIPIVGIPVAWSSLKGTRGLNK